MRPLYSKAAAVAARKSGLNVKAAQKQMGGQIENAVAGGKKVLKHKGHQLPDGSTGMPHFQIPGRSGHTFWGAVGFLASLLDPFDALGGELAGSEYDTIYYDENGSPMDGEGNPLIPFDAGAEMENSNTSPCK